MCSRLDSCRTTRTSCIFCATGSFKTTFHGSYCSRKKMTTYTQYNVNDLVELVE